MKKFPTLKDVLISQDMGEMSANNICDRVLDNTFDANKDPISAIIVNLFTDNIPTDYDYMEIDLDYAINQLIKARNTIKYRNGLKFTKKK